MESKLKFKLEDILKRSVLYKVNKNDYTIKKLKIVESEHEKGSSEEIRVKVAFPDSENQYKNVSLGSYEGGYTVWESTWVLLEFLESMEVNEKLSVLELGAGLGVCGTAMSLKGHRVTFQDLNMNVIKKGLIPNLLLNHTVRGLKGEENELGVTLVSEYEDEMKNIYQIRTESVKLVGKYDSKFEFEFLVGDWNHLVITEQISSNQKGKYDIILASECIYRKENYESIVKIIHTLLKAGGRAYIATKRFYFGLSGGSFQFLQFIRENDHKYGENKLSATVIRSAEPKNSSNVIDLIEVNKMTGENANN
ncbi:conserved hypothetical protein [Theileria orientalis strain Shintoku]|uniref:protein-histidine N-methyltransferase n=1 Tax=Theileria orientalis strain Shintoku TaxID=869250 RepID=J4C8U7_THEOR|nr:conserved hypothetical protein [Theileria orientalis strain Shintoku]BAM41408.1 conserved hypothetical protein [Theileria orientalis strain Shintoku]|eukprot:XP_009691709.1 conserved hypothetical protein [Theileria orientalis strain Shintoku]